VFKLPSTLTIDNVHSIRDELMQKVNAAQAGSFVVDAGELQNIDALGLQLLIAASGSLEKEGCSFQLINVTPVLQELLEVSGGSDLLETEGSA